MGFDPKSTIKKQQIYKLWDEYLSPLSARSKTGLSHQLLGEAIVWDGNELPTPEEALATAVADSEKRRAGGMHGLVSWLCQWR
jgi:hypothetical protein